MSQIDTIKNAVEGIMDNCNNNDLLSKKRKGNLPSRNEIIHLIKLFRKIFFPGYFDDARTSICTEYYIGENLAKAYSIMYTQTLLAFMYEAGENTDEAVVEKQVEEICKRIFKKIPYIQQMLMKDVEAGFVGDPAAKSKEEVIFSYPCLLAISVYRIAHELYVENVPFIPRIMTEYAHSKTGIDINSGATIGEYFFIDHGTGVVIGETTTIGNNVKLYQGVTLGALSTKGGQSLANVKRHPTIEDNVTIYANSTILGGQTTIGHDSVLAGNTFITESIPPFTKVSAKTPELRLKGKMSEQ